MNTTEDLIRACFRAYEKKDRAAIEALLAPDFTFTSPLDDCIDRARYFERCWPNSAHIGVVHIEKLFTQGNEGFAQYRLEPKGKPAFRNTEFFTTRDGLITHVDVYFGEESDAPTSTEDEIRSTIEGWAEAIRNKDVEGVLKHFADDSVRFYLAPPLQSDEPLRKNLEDWFATFRGKIGYEIRDLAITTAADLAYSHALNHIVGEKTNGEPNADVWFRETLCLRRIDDRWLITHTHESVPFYMDGSLKAAVDLKPSGVPK
jgi:uncharacterized protein (TIGR02246 family)